MDLVALRRRYASGHVGVLLTAALALSCAHKSPKPTCPPVAVSVPVASSLSAGAAVVDITPSVGVPLAGFGGPPRRDITPTNVALASSALSGSCVDPNPSDPIV